MHPILKVIGGNMRAIRLKRGLSVEELALKTRTSPTVLWRIEEGRANPAIDVVFRIARTLDVTPADLFREPRKKRRPD